MSRLASLALVMLLSVSAHAQDYAATVASLHKSVLRVAIQKGEKQGTCSAVVFGIVDGRAEALTAAHCVATNDTALDFTVADRSGRVEISNRLLDLAVVTFRANNDTVAVPLAPTTPPAGSPVIIAGYAFAFEGIAFQFGHVAQQFGRETKGVTVNGDIIFGDSGGSLLDAQGRLIGITSSIYSQGPAHLGVAVSIEQVHEFLDEYRDHQKQRATKR